MTREFYGVVTISQPCNLILVTVNSSALHDMLLRENANRVLFTIDVLVFLCLWFQVVFFIDNCSSKEGHDVDNEMLRFKEQC